MGFFFDTLLDHWPSTIAALSIPTRIQILSQNDIFALLSQHPETRRLTGVVMRLKFSTSLLRWIDDTVYIYSKGSFARLGICSFVTADRGPKKLLTGEQVTKLLIHPGIRAASLAYRCFRASQPVSLCIREWRNIPPWSEFRIFIKYRKVLGISQYHWRCTFPKIEDEIAVIHELVCQASACIAKITHIDSVVADIYITGSGEDASWVLIELNPYCSYSCACFFSWHTDGNFDGTLRYRTKDGNIKALPLKYI